MRSYSYDYFLREAASRRCAVLGAGISNRPLIRILAGCGSDCTVFDRRSEEELLPFREELEREGLRVRFSLGEGYLQDLHGFDWIFKTPVMRPDLPEILAECRRGALLTSEMEVFLALCPAEVFGVSGSDGKTTTTTLIHRFLESAGCRCWLGGNIGRPLLEFLPRIREEDKVVLELSSFQLLTIRQSVDTAVLTNISPNHLDVHKDYDEYKEAKSHLFRYQNLHQRFIVNGACGECAEMAGLCRGELIWSEKRAYGDSPLFGIAENSLFYQKTPSSPVQAIMDRSALKVPGRYNALNILSALAAVSHIISPFDTHIREAAETFTGVEHRTELIRELDGVRYYNSSIDSSPNRSLNTLSAFQEQGIPVRLISGGKDKRCDYRGLGKMIAESCASVYLYGHNAAMIRAQIERECSREQMAKLKVTDCNGYEEALRLAKADAKAGDAVLLSPAGTSFDHFDNFMKRGEYFKDLVQQL